jgi:hydroxypyruvate isomerase
VQLVDLGVDTDALVNIHIVRTREWNECMGLLGIANANQDKKERLVAAEVGANDEQSDMMRYVNLNARRMACEQINTMFPKLNVSVEYNTDVDKTAQALTTSENANDNEVEA